MMSVEPSRPVPPRIEWAWAAVVPYALVCIASAAAIAIGLTWRTFWIFLVCYLVRMFVTTVGFHRYFAHRSFKTSRAFQFLLALVGATTLQGGVIWWAETHRRHHRNADTPDDLHSPHYQGFFYSHYGWFLDQKNRETQLDRARDLAAYPELVWLDRWHILPFVAFAVAMGLGFGVDGMLWGVFVPVVIVWELTHWVQSFSHCWGGYRRYDSPDQSRNHWLLGIVTLGEYHNNHHRFASSARQGHAWWEIDLAWYALRVLALLGIIWDLNQPRESAGDPRVGRAAA